ncbi:MAG: hypothetical protein CL805_15555 [Citromicrobium sp.]|nr:hypothetical protein [Citromicrobium sp.]
MLSARDSEALLSQAREADARLILVGDVRRLGSVEEGRDFGQLQEHGMATHVQDQIVRQTNTHRSKRSWQARPRARSRRSTRAGGGSSSRGRWLALCRLRQELRAAIARRPPPDPRARPDPRRPPAPYRCHPHRAGPQWHAGVRGYHGDHIGTAGADPRRSVRGRQLNTRPDRHVPARQSRTAAEPRPRLPGRGNRRRGGHGLACHAVGQARPLVARQMGRRPDRGARGGRAEVSRRGQGAVHSQQPACGAIERAHGQRCRDRSAWTWDHGGEGGRQARGARPLPTRRSPYPARVGEDDTVRPRSYHQSSHGPPGELPRQHRRCTGGLCRHQPRQRCGRALYR